MSGIKLRSTGSCVPSHVMDNAAYEALVDTNDEWIVSRTGIRERRHVREEKAIDLAVAATKQALERSGIRPEEIGVCVVCTASPDNITPSTAALLQRELGLLPDTVCFDLSAACTGFLYGLHTVECLLEKSTRKFGLVVGCEILSRLTNFEDRSTCILFGDGAGAALVEHRADYPTIGAQLGTRGDETALRIPGPGTGVPPHIYMEGSAVFKFAVDAIQKTLQAVLEAHNCSLEDVTQVVMHQANFRIIDRVAKNLKLPPERYGLNIDRYGNTSAASIPLLLDELCTTGRLKPGDRALCVGFGGGLSWGGALIELA